MSIIKTVYNHDLAKPDSYTVEIGMNKKFFPVSDSKNIGSYIKSIWKTETEYHPAYIYFNINWDNDHVLYCKYEYQITDLSETM